MKKTVKSLSIALMAFAMAVCFFFAGLTFVKAASLADVDLSVEPGAQVLAEGNAEDTGLRFEAKILKTDYQALVAAGDPVALGMQVGRISNGSFKSLGTYVVDNAGTTEEEGEYYTYAFAVTYNLDKVFAKFEGEDAEKADLINRMYADELAVRPFYRVYLPYVDKEGNFMYDDEDNQRFGWEYWYGAASEARSMLHVAQAEIADEESLIADKEAFAAKYITETVEKGAVEVYSNGAFETADDDVVTYTIGTSAAVVGREAGKLSAAALVDYKAGDAFKLFGYTADRKVYVYEATFKGVQKFDTIENAESIVVTKAGKVYLNGTTLAGNEVSEVYYNGIELEEALAENLIAEEVGETITVVAKVGEAYYEFTNALYVTKAFENTHESRIELVSTFSSNNRADTNYAPGYNKGTVTGYYVLVENIAFDFSNIPTATNEVEYDEVGDDNEFFCNVQDGRATIFAGTFDGRGYALNNVQVLGETGSTIFGVAGDGATIKNVAIVSPRHASVAKGVYTLDKGAGTTAMIFYTVAAPDADITFENVYYKDDATDNSAYGSSIFYSAYCTQTEGVVEGTPVYNQEYSLGNLTFKNVIIENTSGPLLSGGNGRSYVGIEDPNFKSGSIAQYAAVKDTDSITNTYLISTASVARNAATVEANSRGENFVKYASLEAMKLAINDYSAFSSEYWTIIEGIPAWNAINNIITAVNEAGVVSSAIFSENADEVFEIKALVGNDDVAASKISLEIDGDDIVTVDGNKVTSKANVAGEAVATVKVNGEAVGTIAISVNTKTATKVEEEILVSKATGAIFFNGTSLAGKTATAVAYNGNSVLADGAIVTASIDKAIGEAFALSVVLDDGFKYELTNVKMYDGVYAQANRTELVSMLKYTGELTGYYVLAENITFDSTNKAEYFAAHAAGDVFNATLDGRGYALKEITVADVNFNTGMFGYLPGANATFKNIAFTGFTSAGIYKSRYQGFFFSGKGAVLGDNVLNMENVYIYRFVDTTVTGSGSSNILCYSGAAQLTVNMNNVVIELEFDAEKCTERTANFAGGVPAGTATNTYLLSNSRAGGPNKGYKRCTAGTVFYGSAANANLAEVRALMAAANHDLSSFAAAYWTVSEGLVSWNSLKA